MFTLQNFAIAITVLFLVWYVWGSWLNRRRAQHLIAAIRQAVLTVGKGPTIQWFGRSAFQVDVGQPSAPFTGVHVLCLLEPRDFALAFAWSRLRGRRDQVLIRADFKRAPRQAMRPDTAGLGIAGLTGLELRPDMPHLQITLQVGAGNELSIVQSLEVAQRYGG